MVGDSERLAPAESNLSQHMLVSVFWRWINFLALVFCVLFS